MFRLSKSQKKRLKKKEKKEEATEQPPPSPPPPENALVESGVEALECEIFALKQELNITSERLHRISESAAKLYYLQNSSPELAELFNRCIMPEHESLKIRNNVIRGLSLKFRKKQGQN